MLPLFNCTHYCHILLVENTDGDYLVVRTPSKLTDLLKAHHVSAELAAKHLTIVQGNAKDPIKVAEALVVNNSPVDVIVSGVGGVPVFTNPLRPTLDDPTICQDTTSTILNALRTLQSGIPPKKPVMIVISTTGISDYGRDIPIAMVPLYHWLLPIPHKDKKAMEKILMEEVKAGNSSAIEGFIAVRPSMLTNGDALGVGSVRVGVESQGNIDQSAIGYTISRADVGGWIFDELIENKAGKAKYLNQFVSITS